MGLGRLGDEVTLLLKSTAISDVLSRAEELRERHLRDPPTLAELGPHVEKLLDETAALNASFSALREALMLVLCRLAREIEEANQA